MKSYWLTICILLAFNPFFVMANSNPILLLEDIPKEKWDHLSGLRIFFGHQSVGRNIIDGINKLKTENSDIVFNIKDINEVGVLNGGFFIHENIGRNRYPLEKLDAFKSRIREKSLGEIDVAALKFCYVDFEKKENVELVFNKYIEAVEKIKLENPGITIIHFTAPLRTVQSGFKAWIKELIGKPLEGGEANVFRNEYNKLLVNRYSETGLVFDIAKFESMLPDGGRREFEDNSNTYYSLAEVYTDDGGHLNEMGRKYVAERFLIFLANSI